MCSSVHCSVTAGSEARRLRLSSGKRCQIFVCFSPVLPHEHETYTIDRRQNLLNIMYLRSTYTTMPRPVYVGQGRT